MSLGGSNPLPSANFSASSGRGDRAAEGAALEMPCMGNPCAVGSNPTPSASRDGGPSHGPLAQVDRASGYEPEGQRFESSRAHQSLRDEAFMRQALAEAERGGTGGEVPIGAVVVVDGTVVGRAHNAPVALSDPTAHAEVLALREAARRVGNYRLTGATLFVTVEPCPMCCGAIFHARVSRVVYGAPDPKAGAVESLYRLLDDPRVNHRVEARGGVLGSECAALLSEFFEMKRR